MSRLQPLWCGFGLQQAEPRFVLRRLIPGVLGATAPLSAQRLWRWQLALTVLGLSLALGCTWVLCYFARDWERQWGDGAAFVLTAQLALLCYFLIVAAHTAIVNRLERVWQGPTP